MATNPVNFISGRLDTGMTLKATGLTRGAAGDVIPTNQGLAYLVSERGTQNGPNAVGVELNEAIVRLLPEPIIVELPVTGTVGEGVFVTAAGAVTYDTQDGNDLLTYVHVGTIIDAPSRTPAAGSAFVYLGTATGFAGKDDS